MSVAEASSQSQHLGSESPSVSPPQSAQPYQSIFGGPNTQDVDLQPYTQPDLGEGISAGDEHEEEDLLEYDEEPLPPIPDDDSDDPDYDEGDDDDDVAGDGERFNVPDPAGRRKGKEVIRNDNLTQLPPSSPPQHRPNRYHGPGSTWRKWTERERQIVEGLEEIRARDLAVHLFNAFALKRRAREMKEKSLEDEDYWEEIAGVRVRTAPFVPPRRWTAWPMKGFEVPRPGERALGDEDEAWTLKGQPDPRPSADLEECLIAFMMKTAKERFWQREWMPKERRRKQPGQKEDDGESTGDEAEWETEQGLSDGIERRPVVQTDDDKSRQQLRPLVRNIITRFDNILMGLHHARKASVAVGESSATESDAETVASHSSSNRKRRLTSTSGRSRSRGRKRVRTTSPAELVLEESDGNHIEELADNPSESESLSSLSSSSLSPPPPPRRRRSRSIRHSESRSRRLKTVARYGLRDWSDVLGIASMIDCPQAAVMRAAKRCADLFGEDMVFRTLEEGRVHKITSTVDGETVSEWRYIEDQDEDHEVQQKQKSPPLARRSRSRPRSRRSSTSRKREASVAVATEAAAVVAKEEDSGPGASAPPAPPRRQKGKGKHRKQDIICPVVGCPRHTDGFTRTWNLNLHMKRVHPGYVRGDDREQHADAPVERDSAMQDVEAGHSNVIDEV
ncbi:hypothetical protein VTN77DRAFT_5028 [Rasamsonia byssochlamydoides]|uniref:uncharacterized protein n=1 Tax=Rasamsonia byssochlamydoides TaxID=89139 RepID=UPI003742494F